MIFEDQNDIDSDMLFYNCKENSSLSFSLLSFFPPSFLFPFSLAIPVFISMISSSHLTGPVIRAEVGDTIQVIFYNRASQAFSIQPHGVFYEKDYEGTVYNDGEWAGFPTNVDCR